MYVLIINMSVLIIKWMFSTAKDGKIDPKNCIPVLQMQHLSLHSVQNLWKGRLPRAQLTLWLVCVLMFLKSSRTGCSRKECSWMGDLDVNSWLRMWHPSLGGFIWSSSTYSCALCAHGIMFLV